MLELARALGLSVAPASLELRWTHPVLVVERFDRIDDGQSVRRMHQEDMCQALGVSRHDKYDTPFARCFEIVQRESRSPARDARALLEWQSYNVLCGNDDGHAKNLTIQLSGGPVLAPFYDLVCTAAIANVSRNLAMPVGDSRDSGNLGITHWRKEEEALGLRKAGFTRVVAGQLSALPDALDRACEALAAQVPDSPVLERLPQTIRKRARRIEAGLVTSKQ